MKTCSMCLIAKPIDDFYKSTYKRKNGEESVCYQKRCKSCAVKKVQENYYANHDRYLKYHRENTYTKSRIISIQHRKAMREWIKSVKNKPCVDCNNSFPSICMDFDHRDRSSKIDQIASLVHKGHSKESIQKEIDKCDLVCANCHRIRTAKQMGWL